MKKRAREILHEIRLHVPFLRAAVAMLGVVLLVTQLGMLSRRNALEHDLKLHALARQPLLSYGSADRLNTWQVADLLVDAIVQVESGGDSTKVGRAGERGIMQIKRVTWKQVSRQLLGRPLSFDSAFNPHVNRRIGKLYLAELQAFLDRNRSRWQADERSLLLACYNAGPSRVAEAGFKISRLPASTQSYIDRASALHDHYLAENAEKVRTRLALDRRAGRRGSQDS